MNTKLFIGSLSWGTTDDKLREFFSQAGNVVSARVIIDKMSGRSKGFGFVEMSNADEAQKAINELNGKDLDGRAIAVAEARPEQPRDNNSYGDRGSNGRRGGDYRGGQRRSY